MGAGAWILDDIAPLQGLAEAKRSDVYLFEARPAVRWRSWRRGASLGQREFVAENPEDGAYINYYLKEIPEDGVTITIADANGALVREWKEKEPSVGVNRAVWNLRYDGPEPLESQPAPTGFFARFARQGAPAVPDHYTATLTAAVRELTSQVHRVIDATVDLTEQLEGAKDQIEHADDDEKEALAESVGTALQEVKALQDKLQRPIPGLGYRQYPRLREELRSLSRAILGATSKPNKGQLTRLEELEAETETLVGEYNQILRTTIRELNQMLGAYPRILVDVPTESN